MKTYDPGCIPRCAFACLANLSIFFALLVFGTIAEASEERNLVVLVDRSLSVEPSNRESALRLISELVSGRVGEATRADWKLDLGAQAANEPAMAPERERIKGIFEGSGTGSIAPEQVEFLIGGLGNYQRTVELRNAVSRLGQSRISRGEAATRLRNAAADFGSDDVSTHIRLAESIIAQRLLSQMDRQGGHYFVVISDFEEDCFNRPVSDYATPEAEVVELDGKRLTLAAANQRVHKGEAEYNDGRQGGRGKYSADDVAAIRFFRENVEQLQLLDFIYRGKVGAGKLPVSVRFYAQARKRGLAFVSEEARWIFPDDPPEIAWVASGVSPEAVLKLTSPTGGTVEFGGSIAAKDGEIYRAALDSLLRELFPAGIPSGGHELRLTVNDPADPRPLEAVTSIELVVPETLYFQGDRHRSATRESPAEIPERSEVRDEILEGRIEPAPGECEVQVMIELGGEMFEFPGPVKAIGGEFKFGLSDLSDDLLRRMTEVELVGIRASLAAVFPLQENASLPATEFFLKMPANVEIWAEGFPSNDFELDLSQRLGVTFKSSHAGLPGYQWERPRITFEDGTAPATVSARQNVVTFDRDAAPGTYTIRMVMLRGDASVGEQSFSATVPKHANWMIIVLAAMAVISLALFGWHFFGRR